MVSIINEINKGSEKVSFGNSANANKLSVSVVDSLFINW